MGVVLLKTLSLCLFSLSLCLRV
eukprot:COSAG06_NODE_67848_length_251_cov_0.414474_1_plen_22_part_01